MSQCTYRCVVLPDALIVAAESSVAPSQCTYRCVVLPDDRDVQLALSNMSSQCTYRCVVLPDCRQSTVMSTACSLNAPTGAWCSLTSPLSDLRECGKQVSMHLQVRGAP